MEQWRSLTVGITAAATVDLPFGRKTLPALLPSEAQFARANLTSVLVSDKWVFETSVQKGWELPPGISDDKSNILHAGQHVFLQYNVPNAKMWSGVPLPTLRTETDLALTDHHDCVYAGVVHDDQAKMRISDEMTSIILRVCGRVPVTQNRDYSHFSTQVAQNVLVLEPAGFINHNAISDRS